MMRMQDPRADYEEIEIPLLHTLKVCFRGLRKFAALLTISLGTLVNGRITQWRNGAAGHVYCRRCRLARLAV
jgi:hypothetical protein